MTSARDMLRRSALLAVLLLVGLVVGGTIGLVVLLIGAGLALYWLVREGLPSRRRRP